MGILGGSLFGVEAADFTFTATSPPLLTRSSSADIVTGLIKSVMLASPSSAFGWFDGPTRAPAPGRLADNARDGVMSNFYGYRLTVLLVFYFVSEH